MILVSSPLKRDFIVELIDGYEIDGFTFKHEKSEGMKLFFSTNKPEELDKAIRHVKDRIKGSDLGRTLYFQVVAA